MTYEFEELTKKLQRTAEKAHEGLLKSRVIKARVDLLSYQLRVADEKLEETTEEKDKKVESIIQKLNGGPESKTV